ncbi:family 10 glycosylhydrolase [Thalassotalea sp. G2M2-11]|uniref:glycoside hydrolase family 10 protein n=1 Tax=Thalassotalea sp. G2M2-11 TaxID=2787627 RepID=UPI0019CF7AAA|nr:family 10 glycosylhydrolase [Thalassotalea sp. G2M2-11]
MKVRLNTVKQLTIHYIRAYPQPFIVCAIMLVLVIVLSWPKATFEPPIEIRREFRAAWVATVANINWPSTPDVSVAEQQEQAKTLLDALVQHNFNAVILQVRPQGDALYESELEPWSYYLSGEQGKAPSPYYDPLAFWINEAHQRGIELHAWINPYRVHHVEGGEISEHSLVNTLSGAVVALDSGYYWLDPSHPKSIEHSLAVAKDITERYNIDGLHMDDYFYPYPSYHPNKSFPDQASYQQYLATGGELSKQDWRRSHVNRFVKELYHVVKSVKPEVKLGISPFGIWRPGEPKWIEGFDQYDKLYADARLWLQEGWLDYFSPQLYWRISQEGQSYPMLLNWWQKQNTLQRHIWPGIRTHDAKTERAVDEVQNQIMINRALLEDNTGQIFWHIGGILDNPPMTKRLTTASFSTQALVPASSWLDDEVPDAPSFTLLENEQVIVEIDNDDIEELSHYVVYSQYGSQWRYRVLASQNNSIALPVNIELVQEGKDEPVHVILEKIAVSAVSQTGIESLVTIETLSQ